MKTKVFWLCASFLSASADTIHLETRFESLVSHTVKVGSHFFISEEPWVATADSLNDREKQMNLEKRFTPLYQKYLDKEVLIQELWDVLTVAHSENSLESYEKHWGIEALEKEPEKAILLSEIREMINFLGYLGVPVFEQLESKLLTPGLVKLLVIPLDHTYLSADSVMANRYLMRLEEISILHPEIFDNPFQDKFGTVQSLPMLYFRSAEADTVRYDFYENIIKGNALPESMERRLLMLLMRQNLPGGAALAVERLKFRRFSQMKDTMDILEELVKHIPKQDYRQLVWHLRFYSKNLSTAFDVFFYLDETGVERMR